MAVDTVAAGVEKHKLEMRLIRVRYSFDRALLRVTFSAEGRVDFRELIKDLAAELQTRIDMRQIGVRDEAGILGGVASCGRRLCCCTWLRNFEPVNVKMAKIQRLSLNPGAISGMCGRLKCCLRYENDLYKELSRHVPPEGCTVQCPDGNGRVVGCDVLRQQVQVRLEDERTVTCGVDEVKRANGK
jgi:cell fate regulator YaaT (PSP1 superfamily)